jgi:SAM-dependent methyltransferase
MQIRSIYLKYAKLCCDYGIKPILSPRWNTVESSWKEQTSAERDSCLYIEKDESIDLMFQDILPYLPKSANILEIGCNAGRNLDYLYGKGYINLTGIEIGMKAEYQMEQSFPAAYATTKFITGNAINVLPQLCSSYYDLVFTHATLINIPYCYNSIFKDIVRVSRGYILTMENEGCYRAYPRNFGKMFRKAGCRQIMYKVYRCQNKKRTLAPDFSEADVLKSNTLRLFVKWTNI